MAQRNKAIAALSLTWLTVCPNPVSSNRSDDFLLLGKKYYLRLDYCDKSVPSFFSIDLVRETETQTSGNFLRRTVYIRTTIYDENTGTPFHHIQLCNATFPRAERYTTIWCCHTTDIPGQYIKPRLKWMVTCIFHGIAQTDYQPTDQTISDSPSQLNVKSSSDKSVQASTGIPFDFESLSSDFSKLLENEASPDVKLRSGGSVFSAHKVVLSARSEVFAAMFRNKMVEIETSTVDIKDVEASVLQHLLKYMYWGKIEVVPDDVIPGLYEAGDKYAVLALKRACSERLLGNLTEENCLDNLILLDAHNDESSKAILVDFILKNESVFQSEAWHNFRKKHSILAVDVYQNYMEKKIFSKKHQNNI